MSTPYGAGAPFIELQTVDSTNNYAMGMVHAGMAQHGAAVFAHEQTKGRGQRGKTWVSQGKNNIALSVLLHPQHLAPSEMFLLSMAVAAACHQFLTRQTGDDFFIKWPNDLYWRDRKAGGILIENIWQGDAWRWAIAGVGININQTQFEGLDQRAVSLRQITGAVGSPLAMAQALHHSILETVQQLSGNKAALAAYYQHHLYQRNEWVRLKRGSRVFDARVKEVTSAGELVVQHAVEERFSVGEVVWVM